VSKREASRSEVIMWSVVHRGSSSSSSSYHSVGYNSS